MVFVGFFVIQFNFVVMTQFRNFIDERYQRHLQHHLLQKHKKIVLYFIFGGTAAFVDLAVYLALFNYFNVTAVISTLVSISMATIIGFFLNALINFRVNDRLVLRFISYAAVSGVGMVISSVMLYVLHDMQGFDGNVIKVISLPVIFLVQYILNSRISFRKSRDE